MKYTVLFISVLLSCINSGYSQFWEQVNIPDTIEIRSVGINSTGNIFIGSNQGVYLSTDSALTWSLVKESGEFVYIDVFDRVIINGYYISYDNGSSWSLFNNDTEIGAGNCFLAKDYYTFFSGGWGGIIRSTDNGINWQDVLSFPNSEVINSIKVNTSGEIFAGSINFTYPDGGIYFSDDNGSSWVEKGLDLEFISSLAINSDNEIFAGSRGHYSLGRGAVFRSSDNGNTWTELFSEILVTSIAIASNNDIYIGCSNLDGFPGGIYKSTNNGNTWFSLNSGLDNTEVEQLRIGSDGNIYAVCNEYYTFPASLYKSVNQISSGADNPIETEFSVYNYPNPFSEKTNIVFSLPNCYTGRIKIDLYNSCGSFIEKISLSDFLSGKHTIELNLKDYPGGFYFLKLTLSDNSSQFLKLIKN